MDFHSHEEMFYKYVSDIRSTKTINLKDADIFFSALCAYVEYHGGNLQ